MRHETTGSDVVSARFIKFDDKESGEACGTLVCDAPVLNYGKLLCDIAYELMLHYLVTLTDLYTYKYMLFAAAIASSGTETLEFTGRD